jgi:hypothetical protein
LPVQKTQRDIDRGNGGKDYRGDDHGAGREPATSIRVPIGWFVTEAKELPVTAANNERPGNDMVSPAIHYRFAAPRPLTPALDQGRRSRVHGGPA